MESDDHDLDVVRAPWTPEQVEALNAWQGLGYVHEFTCPWAHREPGTRALIATANYWHCPTCEYTQTWAHDFMADKSKHPPRPTFGKTNMDRSS